ncbi:MAG: terminase large subunit [Spirochaetia bacterium]|nr:terminase large subunit [Spirochaetia bacterium]MCF7945455.1 terminase large subunit [Spirochaetia bacterium]
MNFAAERYIDDVLNNKVTVCVYVRKAVERHADDLQRQNTEEFPYYFDREAAIRKIEFTEQLQHTKGIWAKEKKKIRLEPWQQFIDWCLFGWKRVGSRTRRFTKAYIEVARKNGKTTMAAATANYMLLADHEEGAEIYCLATKKDQAKIAWKEADMQIQKHPVLRKRCKTYKQNSTITIPGTQTIMRPLGKDSDTEDGQNPHFALVDEYHAHKTAELVNVMEDGMGSRAQPLMYIITTAGYDKNLPCFQEERSLIIGILEGTMDPRPEDVFGIVYTLDEGDDWTDENVWGKANPNLGISISRDYLQSQVTKALSTPQKQNSVLTKNFNTWTQAVSRWIGAEAWEKCSGTIPDLSGRPCYGALDLSTNIDITAWVLCFPPQDMETQYHYLYRFFIPEENLLDRERRDKVPYTLWRDQGFITTTPGNVIDYDFIEQQIKQDAETYRLQEFAYDPWNATEITNHLIDEGLGGIPFRQGFASLSGSSKDFEKKILSQEINNGGNPVMKWMISCTEVKTDPAGNIKPVKPDRKATGKRIDGVVASIMAQDRASQAGFAGSIYEKRGVLSL